MSKLVCSQCGAPVMDDSRFCSHCGAKIDDGVERKEIVIDNKAEVKRADYETLESIYRQKQMKRELARDKAAWVIIWIFLGGSALSLIFSLLLGGEMRLNFGLIALYLFLPGIALLLKHVFGKKK